MGNTQNTPMIKFENIKDELIKSINNKLQNNKLHITEPITLIDGFINQPLSLELS
jgi:hypothetical protein